MKILSACFFSFFLFLIQMQAQIPEAIFASNIKTAQLYVYGNQLSYPVIRLQSADRLELHFDDMDAGVRNYSYTYQLCDADWKPAMLSQFDFIKGYSQMRISNYRSSSIAFTRYTHYQAVLPDDNCRPSLSGNYILKVFRDGDTSKLLFTKRLLVVDPKASAAATVQQPFNGQIFRTHQKIQFRLNVNEQLNLVNPLQQIKVVILQNNRWDNAVKDIRPSFYSRTTLDYNTENDCVFPAGKEWRWLDLRSFRLQSDRVDHALYANNRTEIFVKPDLQRNRQEVNFYRDVNGLYTIECTESINPLWQADYARVNFRFVPATGAPFSDKDVYIYGALSDYALNDQTKMQFNESDGAYEGSLFLKQGYYDYSYVTIDRANPHATPSFADTEGNFWETENTYTILVYYRALGGRYDELICYSSVNSLTGRKGIGQ